MQAGIQNMFPCVDRSVREQRKHLDKIALFHSKQELQASTDGILPSPFVINEGDNGRMSHQVTLFFSQKFQQIPDCLKRK